MQPKTPTLFVTPSPPVADGSSVTFNCSSSSESSMTGVFTETLLVTNGSVDRVIRSVDVSASSPYTITVSAGDAGDYMCKITYKGVDSLKSAATTLSGRLWC